MSTYRLQLRGEFGFSDALNLVPYLAALGVTDCYMSPILTAKPGSSHGYDICDHHALNPEIGGEDRHAAFSAELAAHGLGQIIDLVPNHMGIDPSTNAWWRDVLENGQSSPYARFFDIDWDPLKPELKGKVLLPILGDQYGRVLERGELQVHHRDGTFVLSYFEHQLPLNPRLASRVLNHELDRLTAELGDTSSRLRELLSILTELHHMPSYTEQAPDRMAERQREKEVARERLGRLAEATPAIARHIERGVRWINGTPGIPSSFDALHELLEGQAYRLAYWRTAAEEINYRRFFDINELAGLRMEDPAVFEATHPLVLRLVRERRATGLRIDHPDGLLDPSAYFRRLGRAAGQALAPPSGQDALEPEREKASSVTPDRAGTIPPIYTVVEKILSKGEVLPADWAVHGTTGYGFLNDLNGIFVDHRHAVMLRRVYGRFTGQREPFSQIVYECKKLIMLTAMASELNVLTDALNRLSESNRRSRDFTPFSLRRALVEVVACFPVYRTYVNQHGASAVDRRVIDTAIARARRRNPILEPSSFAFLRAVLLPGDADEGSGASDTDRLAFAMKFQQYTGPVHAKGLEDTAFYRYTLLLSLNEVGGDPQRFGRTVQEFHEANERRLADWPCEMITTSTHDTKRGEDARARLNVLSEIPEEWRRAVFRWTRINASSRTRVEDEPAPDRNEEYAFYQALLGAWPAEPVDSPVPNQAPSTLVERLRAYMEKALKEAKVHTSWISPDEAYGAAVDRFVERTLAGPIAHRFLASFVPFQRRVARTAITSALAQVVLKVVSPGVPDFYQGSELWSLTLVDPDNRRPVDYTIRRRYLDELSPWLERAATPLTAGNPPGDVEVAAMVGRLLDAWPDGRIKLYVTAQGLRLRQRLPDLFLEGEYLPLEADGEAAHHVVACARRHGDMRLIAVVPRLTVALTDDERPWPVGPDAWRDTRLTLGTLGGQCRNLLTREVVPAGGPNGQIMLADALRTCPVALLWVR